jgi:hypothetical protein
MRQNQLENAAKYCRYFGMYHPSVQSILAVLNTLPNQIEELFKVQYAANQFCQQEQVTNPPACPFVADPELLLHQIR